jgi:hypothetical protein
VFLFFCFPRALAEVRERSRKYADVFYQRRFHVEALIPDGLYADYRSHLAARHHANPYNVQYSPNRERYVEYFDTARVNPKQGKVEPSHKRERDDEEFRERDDEEFRERDDEEFYTTLGLENKFENNC